MADFGFNAIHYHLLLNHFPVVLSVFGPMVFVYGLYRKNTEIIRVALLTFIASALISVPVYLSWKEAIKTVSSIPGIDIHSLVLHESMATLTFWLILFLWMISVSFFYLTKKRPKRNYTLGYSGIFIFSLMVFLATVFTGYYGWNIRHTEIYSENP